MEQTKTEKLYIFFDTETTGVPRDYKAPSKDTRNWPRMVQLGWILMDDKGDKLSQKDYIIRPDGFTIPADASRIHGITTERALEEGRDLVSVVFQVAMATNGQNCRNCMSNSSVTISKVLIMP